MMSCCDLGADGLSVVRSNFFGSLDRATTSRGCAHRFQLLLCEAFNFSYRTQISSAPPFSWGRLAFWKSTMFSAIGLFLASATSVVNVLMDVCRKKAVVQNDLFAAAFWIRLFSLAVFTLAFLWHLHFAGWPRFLNDTDSPLAPYVNSLPATATFVLYVLADSALVAISVLLYFRALQVSDLSLCIPFLSFTPAMLVLTGAVFLREMPAPEKLVGVGLVVLGSVMMNRSAFCRGLIGPAKALMQQKGNLYMLGAASILSITNPLDKKLVLMSDAFTQAFAYGLTLWIFLSIIAAWHRPSWTAPIRSAPWWLVLAGIFDGSDVLLQFASHKYIAVVITIALKRAGVILAILAGWLIFREKHIGERLIASGVMLCGVLIIYLPVSLRVSFGLAGFVIVSLFWASRWHMTNWYRSDC